METTTETLQVITPEQLLNQWQGHRALTRRVIEAFPEEALFNHTIGGMRPFADMVVELLAIAAPGIKEMMTGKTATFNEDIAHGNKKAKLLELWDQATEDINTYWPQIKPEQFQQPIKSFGQYEGTVWSSIFYFIDNEIHHRGQGYVYLRSLDIEPPFFYER
ncbi:DinB family protein [Flavobacteriaceae bacterium XHP0103]|uniref:DinB family protein n=1 Tax=Marixanthotalea marina TaxID=2844359 RepID=UPI002989A681|nr:DinB family protein [Marixanthotalea marina]MBU3820574.1 DinB family protein [Marixanthotalea marina]